MRIPSITRPVFEILAVAAVGCGLGWLWSGHHQKAEACRVAGEFASAMASVDAAAIERHTLVPDFLSAKSPKERGQLTLNYLADEISPEGMAILQRQGQFGPLRKLFPEEADPWAKAFSVSADDCVAFRLQRGGMTAELVLHRLPGKTYRVLRCNDIRQLAQPPSLP